MNSPIRLAVIGAGSAQFPLGLVRDLCLTASLAGSTVVLTDLDEDRLSSTFDLAVRYAAELGRSLKFEKTIDRDKALKGADFVINTALAGGHSRDEAEGALLQEHGYYRSPYPSESGFYQFGLMLGVASDMERICPDAWLIQSSNPVYDGVTLLTRETKVKVVDPRFVLQHLLFEHRTRSLDHSHETLEALTAIPGNEEMAEHFGKKSIQQAAE